MLGRKQTSASGKPPSVIALLVYATCGLAEAILSALAPSQAGLQLLPPLLAIPLLVSLLSQRELSVGLGRPSLQGGALAGAVGVAIAVFVGSAAIVAFRVLSVVFPGQAAGWIFPGSEMEMNLVPPPLVLVVVQVVQLGLIWPLLEELVFRRCLFVGLATKWSFARSALVSSLVFSLFHWGVAQVAGALVVGIFACALYSGSRNLVYPVILHSVHNLIVVSQSTALFLTGPMSSGDLLSTYSDFWWVALILLALTSALMSWAWARGG